MVPFTLNKTIVRTIWSTLERFAPALGVRRATRLWFTAPSPIPRSTLPPLPPGTDAGITLHGRPLHAVTWGDGPPVYLVHGWGGRSEQLGGFVEPLVAAGHTVVAFDAPAHGTSGPGLRRRGSTIPEFAAALQAAVAVHGRPHAVIAHSFGATAAAYAIRLGVRPERLVLLAPMAEPRRVLAGFAARAGFGPRIRAGLERAVEREVGLPWEAFDVAAMAGRFALPPTLVVHDRRDREVPFRDGRDIAQAWPGAVLRTTEGLGHRRLLRDPAVITQAVGFVSGARHELTGRRSA